MPENENAKIVDTDTDIDTDAHVAEAVQPDSGSVLDFASLPGASEHPVLIGFLALLFVAAPLVRLYLRRR